MGLDRREDGLWPMAEEEKSTPLCKDAAKSVFSLFRYNKSDLC